MEALKCLLRRHGWESAAAVTLAVAGMLGWGGIIVWGRFLDLRQTVQTSRQRLEALHGLAERFSDGGRLTGVHAALWSADSDEALQRRFLEEVEGWIQAGNVPVTIKPKPIERGAGVSRLMIELSMESSQEHLLAFLDRLLGDDSLVVIEQFRLASSGVTTAPMRAAFVLSKPVVQTLSEAPQRPASSAPSSVSVPSSIEQTPSIAMAALRPLFRTGNHTATSSNRLHTDQGNAVVERLQVVGMITGSPSQAILEDPKTHQTHVVRAGQHMGEGVVVEAILPHGVVLSVGGESYERPW